MYLLFVYAKFKELVPSVITSAYKIENQVNININK